MSDDEHTDANSPWAEKILGLSNPSEDDRRRAILNLLREKSFAPGPSEILAIRQNLGREFPPSAVDFLRPTERQFEQLRLALQALRENFWTLPPYVREAELNRLAEESKPIPLFHRYVRQLEKAARIRDGSPTSSDSERLRNLAPDWMFQPPSRFASERLQWFDESVEPNQAILANLKGDDPELYKAVPGFSHYVKPTDPEAEEPRAPARPQSPPQPARRTSQTTTRDTSSGGSRPAMGLVFVIFMGLSAIFRGCARDTSSRIDVNKQTIDAFKSKNQTSPGFPMQNPASKKVGL